MENNRIFPTLATIFLAVALIVAFMFFLGQGDVTEQNVNLSPSLTDTPDSSDNLGGLVFIGARDFPDGIKVDGTTIIDGSGNIDAPITSSTGTFSSTLDVTGAFTGSTGSFSSTLDVTGRTGLGELASVSTSATTLNVTDTLTVATSSFTDVFALSGAWTISGNGSFTGTTAINETASSTLVIGQSGSEENNVGCVRTYDISATSTAVYWYFDSSQAVENVYATTTKPAFCR